MIKKLVFVSMLLTSSAYAQTAHTSAGYPSLGLLDGVPATSPVDQATLLTTTTATANAALPKAGGTISGPVAVSGGLTSTAGSTTLGTTTATNLTVSGSSIFGGFISLTGNQTLTASQCGQTLKSTDTVAVVYTVPLGLSVSCTIDVVQDGVNATTGIGNVTVVGASGEAIKSYGGTVTAGQYAGLLIKPDTTTSAYVIAGN